MTRPYLHNPWFVSIWPGPGSVASTVGDQLLDQLAPRRLESLPVDGFFDIDRVDVLDGVAQTSWMPDPGLYGWRHRGDGPDLLLAIGDAPPTARTHVFCHTLIERARAYGAERILTFGGLATAIAPDAVPRAYGIPNRAELLPEFEHFGLSRLEKGRIASVNGVLLAAATEVGLDAACLLAEIPYFALGMPNPKASLALLEAFSRLANLELDGSVLEHRAERLQRRWVDLFDRVRLDRRRQEGVDYGESLGSEPMFEATSAPDRQRIESLFRAAQVDRARAIELKSELDRLRVFTEYEDRFLDLFR